MRGKENGDAGTVCASAGMSATQSAARKGAVGNIGDVLAMCQGGCADVRTGVISDSCVLCGFGCGWFFTEAC